MSLEGGGGPSSTKAMASLNGPWRGDASPSCVQLYNRLTILHTGDGALAKV
jgi:hypothetical protein